MSKRAHGAAKRLRRSGLILSAVVLTCNLFVFTPCTSAEPTHQLRIAFTSDMFPAVNENDARAAIKVWADTIARERSLPFKTETEIVHDLSSMITNLKSGKIDAAGLTATQLLAIEGEVKMSDFFATVINDEHMEEYVLLVRGKDGIDSMNQLQGRELLILDSPRTDLASIWLDLQLLESGLGDRGRFFSDVRKVGKVSQGVLPVFFGKKDACLVTRAGFTTIVELNPQIGRELEILASSRGLLPAILCFRAGYESEWKPEILDALTRLHESPSGQQVLVMFRGEKLVPADNSWFRSAREMISQYELLRGKNSDSNPSSKEKTSNP